MMRLIAIGAGVRTERTSGVERAEG